MLVRRSRSRTVHPVVTLFSLLIALALLVSGCVAPAPPVQSSADGTSAEMGSAEMGPVTVRVGLLPITDVVPFYVAQALDFFAPEGVEAELIPVSSGAERDTLIQADAIDCQLTDLHNVVLINAGEGDVKLRVISSARKATSELAQFFLLSAPGSGITEPAQLVGKRIGISENTIIEYWTDRLLAGAGVDPATVEKVNVPQIPVRLELLGSGQIDAAVLPDPLASLAQLTGAANVIDDTAQPEIGLSILSCSQSFIAEHRDAVQGLLNAWDQAVEAINADPAQFQNILIENTRVPDPLLNKYTLTPFPVQELPSEAQVQDVVEWALEKGVISAALGYDDIVDASFRQ